MNYYHLVIGSKAYDQLIDHVVGVCAYKASDLGAIWTLVVHSDVTDHYFGGVLAET